MSFTETIAAGRAFARSDEPPPRAEPGAARHGPRKRRRARSSARCRPAAARRRPPSTGMRARARQIAGARDRARDARDDALPRAPDRPDAAGDAGRRRHRLLDRPDQARRIPRRSCGFGGRSSSGRSPRSAASSLLGTLKGILVAIILSLVGPRPPDGRTRPCTCSGASPAPTSSGRARGSIRTTRRSRDCCCCGPRAGSSSPTPSASAQKIRALAAEAQPKVVALDMSAVFDLEYTALKMLTEGEKRQREQGVDLWLVGLTPARARHGAALAARRDSRA